MSRKKSKKLKTMIINTQKTNEEKKDLVPTVSKKEQLANMLFNNFFKNAMKMYNYFENDYVIVTPYIDKGGEEKDDGTDIVCYEITPKSNKDVVIYLDDKEIYASLEGAGVKMDDDALTFLTTNIIGYVRDFCKEDAA